MEAVYVRPARREDVDTIVEFAVALAAESEGRRLDSAVVGRAVERALGDPTLGRYFMAELGGQVVGQLMITTEFTDWRDGVFWWIQSVYVRLAVRRQGVYRALHEYVARVARQQDGVCGLRLYAERENRGARQVYERLGMRPTNYVLYESDWSVIGHPEAGQE